MTDLYLGSDVRDFVFEGGDIKWVPTKQELCRQNVTVAMRTFRGEWFRDTTFGVPWLENENNIVSLLGEKDKVAFDAELRKVILRETSALKILNYKTEFDKLLGVVKVFVEILSEDGPVNIATTL